jgi:NAD(P)H dehydrogenase (quinone)
VFVAKVLVVYDSRTGNTERMARAIKEGAEGIGVDVELKKVDDTKLSDLEAADGIILGSPTYFGSMSAKMKGLVDRSAGLFAKGRLKNKVGAAFTSADCTGSGAETTLLSLIAALIQYEAIIVSAPGREAGWPGTYGVIADDLYAIGSPNEKMLDSCKELGKRVADTVKKLA